jgi:predicted MFS family arabinose efflux permease
MMGNFAIIPNLTVYWVFNRGYPRPDLPVLYLVGGLCTFVTMRLSGSLVDRYGPTRVALGGTLLFMATLFVGFITPIDAIPILLVSVLFMTTGTFRIIPMQSIATRLPAPPDRARFMSTQSAVQHLASALGAFVSSIMLSEGPGSTLIGMEHVALLTAGLALTFPCLLYFVESDVTRREEAARESLRPSRP